MLSAYPTKHSRVGNAVGLDTPVSAIRLLRGDARRGLRPRRRARSRHRRLDRSRAKPDTEAGNALIHALIEAGGQDEEWLTTAQLTDAATSGSRRATTARWTADLPADLMDGDHRGLGRGAGRLFVDDDRTARSCSPRSRPATSCS